MADLDKVTYFAFTDARNKRVKFGIKADDRTRHVYVIGKTGMGKSTLLENMAVQDIQNGNGFAFIDPHGKTTDLLLEYIPAERMKDVVYFAPFDTDYPISFNVLEQVDPDKRHLVVSGLMSTFKKIWQDAWSARMEYILTNTLLALLEYPGATLLGVNRMLADKEYRKRVVDNIKDPGVRSFWVDEFAKYTEKFAAEATPAIQNKIGQFTANPLIRNMIGQEKSSFDIRDIMDKKKIMIINLSKGKIGESNANLLGGMLITKIYLGAMSRADVSNVELNKLPNFYLYVDEFQNFANESFADILSEARKYKLNLTIAHQYIEQMEEEVAAAVFGNVGTMIVFRVGAQDAEVLEKEFAPKFTAEDLVNLGKYQIYLKLMIDGVSSQPFSATNMPPIPQPEKSLRDEIIASSREQFALKRADIEGRIADWHQPIVSAPKRPPSPVGAQSSVAVSAPQAPRFPAPQNISPQSRPAPQRFDQPRREEQRPVLTQTPIPRASVIPPIPKPPIEPSDGFSSLADIGKQIVRTEEKAVARVEQALHMKSRQNNPQREIPPKKAGTESAKADLRAVLSQAMKQQAQTVPAQNPQPKAQPQMQTTAPKPVVSTDAAKEVPADVLKKILEVNE